MKYFLAVTFFYFFLSCHQTSKTNESIIKIIENQYCPDAMGKVRGCSEQKELSVYWPEFYYNYTNCYSKTSEVATLFSDKPSIDERTKSYYLFLAWYEFLNGRGFNLERGMKQLPNGRYGINSCPIETRSIAVENYNLIKENDMININIPITLIENSDKFSGFHFEFPLKDERLRIFKSVSIKGLVKKKFSTMNSTNGELEFFLILETAETDVTDVIYMMESIIRPGNLMILDLQLYGKKINKIEN